MPGVAHSHQDRLFLALLTPRINLPPVSLACRINIVRACEHPPLAVLNIFRWAVGRVVKPWFSFLFLLPPLGCPCERSLRPLHIWVDLELQGKEVWFFPQFQIAAKCAIHVWVALNSSGTPDAEQFCHDCSGTKCKFAPASRPKFSPWAFLMEQSRIGPTQMDGLPYGWLMFARQNRANKIGNGNLCSVNGALLSCW